MDEIGQMKNKVKEFLRESNAIEGVYATHSLKVAQKAWGYLISQNKLDDLVVKKTHYLLMKDTSISSQAGYYRQQPVWIGGKEAVDFLKINYRMDIWFKALGYLFISTAIKTDEAREKAIKELHVDFEKTHPFIDGNGRIGRMLLNWSRVKLDLPILVIKEAEKSEYYKWFK